MRSLDPLNPKPELLRDMVLGTSAARADIDAVITGALTKDRELYDLEAVLRALLRVAVYELRARENVPAKALLSIYAGIGDAFFDEDGPQSKLIAGVLNAAARKARPSEFPAPDEASVDG